MIPRLTCILFCFALQIMSMLRRSSRITTPMCQNQEGLASKFSFCGMLSVNNALQIRDFLTQETMIPVLRRLRETDPDTDHGCEHLGAYTTAALHLACRLQGYNIVYLPNLRKFRSIAREEWYSGIASSSWTSMLIIGQRPGQDPSEFHCVARTFVNGKFWLVDSDVYFFVECTAENLKEFFPVIVGMYGIQLNTQ